MNINVKPGTVEVRGSVAILNVGDGDTKLSFDPSNPAERIRAARIVKDMIRRGYALLVETEPGSKTYRRVRDFDEERCEYIIADFDPLEARKADDQEASSEGPTDEPTAAPEGGAPEAQAKQTKRSGRRGPNHLRRLPADSTRAVSVGRTAGG